MNFKQIIFYRVRLNYATTHYHPPPHTTIHHHPPPAKIYPPPSTTTHRQLKYSLLHMKITASLTESWYQDRGPCYLHLAIFFLIHKKLLPLFIVFLRKLDHRLLSNHICYETALVWGLVSTGLTIATHCLLCKTCYFKSVKFQLLLFSTELKEVCSNCVTATGFEPTTT